MSDAHWHQDCNMNSHRLLIRGNTLSHWSVSDLYSQFQAHYLLSLQTLTVVDRASLAASAQGLDSTNACQTPSSVIVFRTVWVDRMRILNFVEVSDLCLCQLSSEKFVWRSLCPYFLIVFYMWPMWLKNMGFSRPSLWSSAIVPACDQPFVLLWKSLFNWNTCLRRYRILTSMTSNDCPISQSDWVYNSFTPMTN